MDLGKGPILKWGSDDSLRLIRVNAAACSFCNGALVETAGLFDWDTQLFFPLIVMCYISAYRCDDDDDLNSNNRGSESVRYIGRIRRRRRHGISTDKRYSSSQCSLRSTVA